MSSIIVALAAWFALAVAMLLGNTAGYHRQLAHRSYDLHPGLRRALVLLSALHAGSPMQWVALHRVHHAFADTPLDAHSPQKGFWSAHCGWLIGGRRAPLPCLLFALSGFGLQVTILVNDLRRLAGRRPAVWRRTTRDLARDPLIVLLDRPLVVPALFALQVAAAWALGRGWGLAWLWSLHLVQNNLSWLINSVCHHPAFGQSAGHAHDGSRNVSWLGWLTLGDSFHGNHHADPTSADHGGRDGVDLTYQFVRALQRLKLARGVRTGRTAA